MKQIEDVYDLLTLHSKEFVSAAYKLLLGRPVDDGGLNHYLKRLQKGYSKEWVLYNIIRSKEYSGRTSMESLLSERSYTKNSDKEFLREAYKKIFGREADRNGLLHHMDLLASGITRKDILRGLVYSEEARNHRGRLNVKPIISEQRWSRIWPISRWIESRRLHRRLNALEELILTLEARGGNGKRDTAVESSSVDSRDRSERYRYLHKSIASRIN